MRPFAAASLTLLAVLASAATLAHAMPCPTKPGAGASILSPVNGERHGYGHPYRGRGYHHTRSYFYLMYAVHDYPRGISATFGAPRCCCYCRRDW